MKKTVNLALATLAGPSRTTIPEMVSLAHAQITAIYNSPDIGVATEVKASADAWAIENDNLEAIHKNVQDLINQLALARASEAGALRRWKARKRGTVAAVTTFCDGSKDQILSFNFAVAGRTPYPLATVVQGLQGKRSNTVNTATVVWKTTRGNQGFMVQYATDAADPATYSAPISSSKGTFVLTGQTPGATLYFRVLALDARLPTGQTDYTPWVAVTVSS